MNCTTPSNCGCGDSGLNRRDFLTAIGAGSLAILASRLPVMAGPFESADFDKIVPADKKLSPEWLRSLFERGTPAVYRGAELKYIGMPVGGLTTGQLYLGGDGRLWHWDIFNHIPSTGADHYAHPVTPKSPVEQGFAIRITKGTESKDRTLNAKGFADVSFSGQYPIGTVEYKDSESPVTVTLEAFSPFAPLAADDSSVPATVLRFTVTNISADPIDAMLAGWLQNTVLLHSPFADAIRRNRIVRTNGMTFLDCSAVKPDKPTQPGRPDVAFEDWNKDSYDGWTTEGTAFGSRPARRSEAPDYVGELGGEGDRLVHSHISAPGGNVGEKDAQTGKLTSKPFKVERNFINFWIGGGSHKGKTCLNLVVNGKAVQTATGADNNKMSVKSFDVRSLAGKDATIVIVDADKGSWGNVGVGRITFSDMPAAGGPVEEMADYGAMGLALLGEAADQAFVSGGKGGFAGTSEETGSAALNEELIGAIGRKLSLAAGKSATVDFVLAWNFPNLKIDGVKGGAGRHYATRFDSAQAAAKYVAENFGRFQSQTKLWRDTFYDSTLPYWLLDRAHLNISILATSTAYRFKNGRFYGWEGVGCCAGTCTHVWQYEQAMGRLFPEFDILLRERADFNPEIGFNRDGMIDHRGEYHAGHAIDGQAGTILRAYRDHQMSADDAFLKRNWASIKKAIGWLIGQDGNADGILEGPQHNTLDVEWYGPVAWLSGMYLASLRAGEEMAKEVGDEEFARQCRAILDPGVKKYVELLFNGEYFMNIPDPKHLDAINSGSGCEIDQVMGQSWAWQVGLGRVLPGKETRSALQSLWRYSFSPDVGPYRKINKPGRWYAMPGEAGLLICTFPRSDWNYDKAKGKPGQEWAAGYFNECQNGYEHEVAGHMVWEGLVQEGLAVERAIHDRYHPSRRNPWNEVECGDHYARSMASYGVFIAACGYEYHGPKGHLAFAPRLTPENFKAAFTAAEGWGSFSQKLQGTALAASIEIKSGRLRLRTLGLALPPAVKLAATKVTAGGKDLEHTIQNDGARLIITLAGDSLLEAGQKLEVVVG